MQDSNASHSRAELPAPEPEPTIEAFPRDAAPRPERNGGTPDGDEGLQRWDHWLRKSFPRACFRRTDLCSGTIEPGEEVVWQVEVRNGKDGRIHVTGEALSLDPDGFAEVTHALEANDWYGLVDRFVRVRIAGNGTVGALNVAR